MSDLHQSRRYETYAEGNVACSFYLKNDIEKLWLTAVLGNEDSQPIDALLRTINDLLLSTDFLQSTVLLNFFVADTKISESIFRKVSYMFGKNIPAVTVVQQPPCNGKILSLDLFAIRSAGGFLDVQYPTPNSVLLESATTKTALIGNITPQTTSVGAYRRSLDAFLNMQKSLKYLDFDVEDVFRTWIYQGHLTDIDDGSHKMGECPQRYQELNRARTDFFNSRRFLTHLLTPNLKSSGKIVYPASTGIGATDFDVVMSCMAMKSKRAEAFAVPLENPMQTSACDYSENYSPESPKFSRAMAILDGVCCTIYISGTASITSSETQHPNDPVAQTHQTLDNIASLISGDNLQKHGIKGFRATLRNLVRLRVYVKRQSDYAAIKTVCDARCPSIPTLYTIADVCRGDLLVEIEGTAIA